MQTNSVTQKKNLFSGFLNEATVANDAFILQSKHSLAFYWLINCVRRYTNKTINKNDI